jgi:cysteine synthase A
MIDVADVDSVAAMHCCQTCWGARGAVHRYQLHRHAVELACEMRAKGEHGSILSLLCDAGERYLKSYFDADWACQHMGDYTPASARLQSQLIDVD